LLLDLGFFSSLIFGNLRLAIIKCHSLVAKVKINLYFYAIKLININMIGAIIAAAISAIASGVGTHLANKKKAQAQEKYESGINKEVADLDAEINSNYLDRADARNAIRQVTDATSESMRQLNTDAIRGGATDEAKVAMASKLNKNIANTVGTLAGIGEQHKDRLRGQKRNLRLGLLGHQYNVDSDTSGITTMLQGISNAASTIGAAATTKGANATTTPDTPATTSYSTPTAQTQAVTSAGRAAAYAANNGDAWAAPIGDILENVFPSVDGLDNLWGNKQIKYGETL
jgi:hypothetical protein